MINSKTKGQIEFSGQCECCKRSFKSERVFLNHLCEPKRRILQRQERAVTLGLHAFQHFWTKRQSPRHIPTWEDFEKSSLYLGFVRFGRHILAINAINPVGFVDFLLRGEVGIDDWCKQSIYDTYIRELTKLETPMEAIERNIMLLEQWGMHNNEHWSDFFRKVAPSQAVLWILSGRISPLLIFTASSVNELFSRLTGEQIKMIECIIDEKFWEIKMSRHKDEVDAIIKELADNNV